MLGDSDPVPETTAFELHNSLVYWVTRLSSVMRESFNDALSDANITWPQWMALNVLYHDQAETPAQIADHIGVDRSAVTRLLDRLADKQWLERTHDDGDRRSVRVALTLSGKQKMRRVDDCAKQHQERYLAALPATEVRAFKGNLQKLLRAGGIESKQAWRRV